MSKIGLLRRTSNIDAAIKAYNPRGYAIHYLPPKLRNLYDSWRTECDRIAALHNGSLYEALLNEQDIGMPPMPAVVAAAINTGPRITIASNMSLDEVQDIYKLMLEEGR